MKILVTGFDPFDQEEINPSYEVVKGLPDQINGHEILKVRRTDIPAEISYTAGTYVCNSLMYHVLYLADRRFPGLKGGFIHVPDLPHNGKSNKLTPSMSLEDMVSGISVAIESIDFPESCANFGTII